jgi:hypothetical protein
MNQIMDSLFTDNVQFNDFYNKLFEMIYYSDFYNSKPIGDGDREGFISTIAIGFICNSRTFESKEEKKEQFIKMFKSMINLFKNYTYEAKNYYNLSFMNWLGDLFSHRISLKDKSNEILELIPIITENIYNNADYYNVQENIDKLFNSRVSWHNRIHEDYLNYMTFITVAFLNSIDDKENKKELTFKYLKHLFEFNRDDDICVYDNYDYKNNPINL